MHVSGNTITGRIFSEQAAMIERALRIAKRTRLPVELRSYTFDGLGRRKKYTFYEGHVLPNGETASAEQAKEWYDRNHPELMPVCWQ